MARFVSLISAYSGPIDFPSEATMNLDTNEAELAFRAEVRAFIEQSLPADIRQAVLMGREISKEYYLRWQRILYERGWGAPGWQKAFGGTGWNAVEKHIFDEETTAAGAPGQIAFGLAMVAPVIMAYGTPAQQQRFLPRILSGEDWWCQGYSEPGSGSDLASLKMRAELEPDGKHYVLNGQKTWNTLGQHADWIFCLVRTNTEGRPQAGISFVLVDMKSPGITVRPIIMLDGGHEINDVFFDNVKVPVENRIGEENKGWSYAKFLLGHERTGLALIGQSKRVLKRLKNIAALERANSRPLIENQRFRDRIARVEIDLTALDITMMRLLSADPGKPLGPEVSMLKIRGTEILQVLTELSMLACGHAALASLPQALKPGWEGVPIGHDHTPPIAGAYFNMRKLSIFGGSNEIQKNIVSQMILGL